MGPISPNIIAIERAMGRASTVRGERGRRVWAAVLCACLLAAMPARALDIELVSGDWQPINIVVELFVGEDNFADQVPSDIVAADLKASGNFRVQKEVRNSLRDMTAARLTEIRERGVEYLLTGAVEAANGADYVMRFSLYDALTGEVVGAYALEFVAARRRAAAHNVANWVYEEIIGKPGVFHTKVAYVLRHDDGTSELKIADYDGYNRLTVLSSENDIMSPAWSPDGNRLLYVSFEQNKPVVYAQSLLTGRRSIVANFKGSNSAPAYAPDNRTVAAALTVHGGVQQVYLLTEEGKTRLRESDGIDTEPVFAPDGARIAFTSDTHGLPQIFEYELETRSVRQLTHRSYHVSADYSADGETLALVRRDAFGDNIALLDIATKRTTALTQVRATDSPSFAPNDDIIAFVDESRKKYLAMVAINGKVTTLWGEAEAGNIVNPVWSPVKSDWF